MNNKQILNRVFSYVGRYKIHLAFSLLLAAVSVAGTLYVPVLLGNVIDFIADKGNVDFDGMVPILVEVCVIVGVVALSQWIMNVLNNKITFGVVKDMRDKAFSKIEKLPVSYIDSHPSGEIVSRVIADVDQFAKLGERQKSAERSCGLITERCGSGSGHLFSEAGSRGSRGR